MLEAEMEQALNDQVNAELYSSYLYLSMASYLAEENLGGFANWMRIQAQEEVVHAMKIYDYILERGGRAVMQAIEQPEIEWDSALDVAETTYEHEQKVTASINDLVDLAEELSDHATKQFLQWFVEEQVEEEDSADELVQQLKMVEGDARGLLMLDKELAQRAPLVQMPQEEAE